MNKDVYTGTIGYSPPHHRVEYHKIGTSNGRTDGPVENSMPHYGIKMYTSAMVEAVSICALNYNPNVAACVVHCSKTPTPILDHSRRRAIKRSSISSRRVSIYSAAVSRCAGVMS